MGGVGLAAAAGLLSMRRAESAAEPPPETTTLRTAHGNTMCEAPQSFAEELLRAEGFTDVRYVVTQNVDQELAAGKVDMVLRDARSGSEAQTSAPFRMARSYLVDSGRTPRYDLVRQALKDIPYGRWRDYDPEDTVRFYALRLREAGMIRSTPQKIIAVGTDWRVLTELKKELKG
jgi:hypothetical protein